MIDVRVAGNEIEAVLRTIDAEEMPGYRGDVLEPVPTPPNDQRVKAYWALWDGAGVLDNSRIVPSDFVSVLSFSVTVAGGTVDRVLFGVEQVRNALSGTEIASGLITEQPFDPGPIRADRSIKPLRYFVPLSYQLEP